MVVCKVMEIYVTARSIASSMPQLAGKSPAFLAFLSFMRPQLCPIEDIYWRLSVPSPTSC